MQFRMTNEGKSNWQITLLHAITIFLVIYKDQTIIHNKYKKLLYCNANVALLFKNRGARYGRNQTSVDQFIRLFNGISNAPVYMKINKSVKMNIKCILLLIP